MLGAPYYANTLIDVLLPSTTVATPGERRGQVVLFPMPALAASGRLARPNVMFDTGSWFVHDPSASTLPARCPSQRAAQLLADTWLGNCARGTVDPSNAEQVVNWCNWFVEANPDCAILAPLQDTPPAGALAMAEWPQGTDEEAAVELTAKLAAIAVEPITTQALPDEGQADETVTEAAS
jgi:hypothetical protein